MKFLLNIFVIFNLLFNSDLIILNLRESYKINDNICFIIKNKSKSKIFYYTSLESYDNGSWKELIGDINNPKSISSEVFLIKSLQQKKYSKSLDKIFYLKNFMKFEKYRIKITYGSSIEKLNNKFYSQSFKIEN